MSSSPDALTINQEVLSTSYGCGTTGWITDVAVLQGLSGQVIGFGSWMWAVALAQTGIASVICIPATMVAAVGLTEILHVIPQCTSQMSKTKPDLIAAHLDFLDQLPTVLQYQAQNVVISYSSRA